jgi:hypothetical protein
MARQQRTLVLIIGEKTKINFFFRFLEELGGPRKVKRKMFGLEKCIESIILKVLVSQQKF